MSATKRRRRAMLMGSSSLSASSILAAKLSRPGKQWTVGRQQHCFLGHCRGDDDAVERIAVQIVEPHRCHGDLGRQAYLTHAQRQDAIAPCPNVRRPFNKSTPEA